MTPLKFTVHASELTLERVRAIELFRKWDAVMVEHHGELYYRSMKYTVH
ncbi:hypothetical protein [Bradyrhizobium lupini]